jgi:hypothetical protein
MSSKKVLLLTLADFAYSGKGIYNAVKKYTNHNIFYIDQLRQKPSKVYTQTLINKVNIVHLKGDWPLKRYGGLNFKGKKIIQTVGGSCFRKREFEGVVFGQAGRACYDYKLYKKVDVLTSLEPDLMYPEFKWHYTPYPIDSMSVKRLWKWQDPPVLSHFPSNRIKKDTDFILEVFKKVSKQRKVIIDVPEDKKMMPLSFDEGIERKKKSTFYFDQFLVGAYGNSAVEAMQFGVPVACWIAPFSFSQAKGEWDNCPLITTK